MDSVAFVFISLQIEVLQFGRPDPASVKLAVLRPDPASDPASTPRRTPRRARFCYVLNRVAAAFINLQIEILQIGRRDSVSLQWSNLKNIFFDTPEKIYLKNQFSQ